MFVQEVQKAACHARNVRVAIVGSRKHMCVNDTVRRLGGEGAMNDICKDMLKKSTPKRVAGEKHQQKEMVKDTGFRERLTPGPSKAAKISSSLSPMSSSCAYHSLSRELSLSLVSLQVGEKGGGLVN
ncbi:hypothetical protein EON64_19710, partial [archaeon]